MMKNPGILCISLALGFILSLSLVNSQALIAGKIYNSDFSDIMEGAEVSITCNSNTLNTNSLGDGTYAVRFDETKCNESDSVSVVVRKSGFQEKTGSGIVSKCDGPDCKDSYVTIINLGMKIAPANNEGTGGSNGGGSSGSISVKYYLCGNGKCDTGETTKTCPKDCKEIVQLAQDDINKSADNQAISSGEINDEEQTEESGRTFYSVILGAVIGADGRIRLIVPIIFIALVIAISIIVFIRRRK